MKEQKTNLASSEREENQPKLKGEGKKVWGKDESISAAFRALRQESYSLPGKEGLGKD
jgi:hypothetical protein